MTQKTKICSRCSKEKPATTDYFYYYRRSADGLRYWCKECYRDYKREHRKEIAETNKKYHARQNHKRHNFLNSIHRKIIRLKSKQKYCSICNEEKKLELSSIDGKYTEDVKDYWWLCRECHTLYDRTNKTHLGMMILTIKAPKSLHNELEEEFKWVVSYRIQKKELPSKSIELLQDELKELVKL